MDFGVVVLKANQVSVASSVEFARSGCLTLRGRTWKTTIVDTPVVEDGVDSKPGVHSTTDVYFVQ